MSNSTAEVRQLFGISDIFFANCNEMNGLYESAGSVAVAPGHLVFVTDGSRGATLIESNGSTHLPAESVDEIDPTGAGDTFCGATLTYMVEGASAVEAMRQGITVAAATVQHIGPEGLLKVLSGAAQLIK